MRKKGGRGIISAVLKGKLGRLYARLIRLRWVDRTAPKSRNVKGGPNGPADNLTIYISRFQRSVSLANPVRWAWLLHFAPSALINRPA